MTEKGLTAKKIEALEALRRAAYGEAKVGLEHKTDSRLRNAASDRYTAAYRAAVAAGATFAERDLATELGAHVGALEAVA